MGLTFNFPLNQIKGFEASTEIVSGAYLVIDKSAGGFSYDNPKITCNVYFSKAVYEAGGATPLLTSSFEFAMIINPVDEKTYVVNRTDNSIAIPLQSFPEEPYVVDIDSTAYLYFQTLLGGVIE